MRLRAALLFAILATAVAWCANALSPNGLTANDVLQHLNKTITWYRHVEAADEAQTAPENLLLQDNVRETSTHAVELAFAFARAEAAILQTGGQDTTPSSNSSPAEDRTLHQAALTANQRVASLQAKIQTLNKQIEKETGPKRVTLVSQRETMAAYLDLAKESQQAIQDMMSFANTPGASSQQTGLLEQINELANSDSIPAALNPNSKSSPVANQAPQAFHPETSGAIPLLAHALNLGRNQGQLSALIRETTALLAEVGQLKVPLRNDLRSAINDGNAIVSAADTESDPAQLAAARKQINDLAARFKNSSSVMIPLREQGIVLEAARSRLQDWENALAEQQKTVFRYLALRLAILALAVIFVLVFSRVWHKGILKYVREPRRRRQLMLVRRFVIIFGIVLALALGIFSNFASTATFIGLLTAGLALALQNVILSVVAYFFLIGRYGIRVGDRVSISGVPGQVIEIGLVRFFLMELSGSGADAHPTGRVAAWANSMIFQPYSWLKQAPGTDYTWHLVKLTISPDADYETARRRLAGAVNAVFETYRENIEQQHAAFEEVINLQVSAPNPVTRAHFTEQGIEIFIRYPVEFARGAEIDEQVVQRLAKELDQEPPLKLAPGGAPKLQLAPF